MAASLPVLAIRQQISSGVDIIVHLGRLRDKSRKVIEIIEVIGMEDGEIITKTLYRFQEKRVNSTNKVEGQLEMIGEITHVAKLQTAGLYEKI